jgi:hypothetical protein
MSSTGVFLGSPSGENLAKKREKKRKEMLLKLI